MFNSRPEFLQSSDSEVEIDAFALRDEVVLAHLAAPDLVELAHLLQTTIAEIEGVTLGLEQAGLAALGQRLDRQVLEAVTAQTAPGHTAVCSERRARHGPLAYLSRFAYDIELSLTGVRDKVSDAASSVENAFPLCC